ncbi:MAG: hypothetical protein ACI8W3_003766 [Myxococcota bacterium]|jgi:hypothetical protein
MRSQGRQGTRVWIALVCVVAIGAGIALLGQDAEEVQTMAKTQYVAPKPAPAVEPEIAAQVEFLPAPFERRKITPPVEGEPLPSETAAYCDEGNWAKMDLVVSKTESGEFSVRETAWHDALSGGQVGIANWMSQCFQNGDPVQIVSADTGDLLAVYDGATGLRSYR